MGLKFNILNLPSLDLMIIILSKSGFCSSIKMFSSRTLGSVALATVANVSGTCLISVNKISLDLFTGPDITGAE